MKSDLLVQAEVLGQAKIKGKNSRGDQCISPDIAKKALRGQCECSHVKIAVGVTTIAQNRIIAESGDRFRSLFQFALKGTRPVKTNFDPYGRT